MFAFDVSKHLEAIRKKGYERGIRGTDFAVNMLQDDERFMEKVKEIEEQVNLLLSSLESVETQILEEALRIASGKNH